MKKNLVEVQNRLRRLITEVRLKIQALPDNPRINRLSDRSFILSSNQLGRNWDPFYHDFKAQYQYISERIEKMETGCVVCWLDKLIKNEHEYVNYNMIKFHPEVIAHIKGIWEH